MKAPHSVMARRMDICSEEYREMTQGPYHTFQADGGCGLLVEHNAPQNGSWLEVEYGPLFLDVPGKCGTDRYLIGWIEEDDTGEVAESSA